MKSTLSQSVIIGDQAKSFSFFPFNGLHAIPRIGFDVNSIASRKLRFCRIRSLDGSVSVFSISSAGRQLSLDDLNDAASRWQ